MERMDPELKKKLASEEPLSLSEAMQLDERLAAGSGVSRVLKGLEDGEPSLAWRSALNERLREVAADSEPKGLARWFGRNGAVRRAMPIAASGVAAAILAVAIWLPRSGSQESTVVATEPATVEDVIIESHFRSEGAQVLGVSTPSTESRSYFNWNELESPATNGAGLRGDRSGSAVR